MVKTLITFSGDHQNDRQKPVNIQLRNNFEDEESTEDQRKGDASNFSPIAGTLRNTTVEKGNSYEFEQQTGNLKKEENVNDFVRKKTLAQGFLDFALLAANAAQLKRILSTGEEHNHYKFLITLISISIALQVVQAILMCMIGIFLDMNIKKSHPKHIITNNLLLMSTALCVGVNVLVSAFDIAESK